MPNPNEGEFKQEYISRFMGSDEAKRDFPDYKQRLAVAYSKWENRKSKKAVKAIKKVLKKHSKRRKNG